MIALVAAVTLFGRVLPTWTLSLATIAASNALIALGIVVLARTGNVSFGQGLFFAAGGYGVALIANAWGLTDAVAQVIIGAACGGLLGLVIGPLIARYSGIFFGMLTLALSMVFYGALVKSTALGGSDGFNVGRPSLFGMSFTDPREADFMLYAVSVIVTGFAGIAATILFRSEFGLASLAVRENNLRVEYLGLSANRIISINFVIAAIFAGASGAFALMAQRHIDPQFAYWTTSGEFVFVAVLAGNQSVAAVFVASMALELVRSFSNLYLPNTWQLVLGVFLLGVILFLPRGIGSLWIRDRRKRRISAAGAARRRKRSRAVNPVLSVRGLEKRFGAVVAADALTLDIPAGQKISLIGANGAGKTTFVNMVTGYLKPDSGTIAARRNRHRQALAAKRSSAWHLPFLPDSATVRRAHRRRKSHCGDLRHRRTNVTPGAGGGTRPPRQGRRIAGALWPCRSGRSPDLGACGRRAQADRYRHGAGAPSKTAAAGRADLRRIGGRKIHDHGSRDPRRRARRSDHRIRRARHGDRQPLCRSRGGVLSGPDSGRRRCPPRS